MQIKPTDAGCIVFSQASLKAIIPDWFTFDYWQDLGAITGSSKGRYTTWFVNPAPLSQAPEEEWVLRHYYRGGMMEKFSRDAYLYTGLKRCRAIAEFNLLEQLFKEGFAVPEPVAAQIQRSGPYYRGDIIIKRIPSARDLVAELSQAPMSDEKWQALGACIAKFHRRGVYHADLNAKNILLAGENFTLIDFDRGALKQPDSKWQQANLDRLLRSFNKEKGKAPELHFTQENWQQLLAGYARA